MTGEGQKNGKWKGEQVRGEGSLPKQLPARLVFVNNYFTCFAKGAGGGKSAPPKNSKDAATRPFVFVFFFVSSFFSFCKSRICVKNNKYFTFNKSFSFVGVFPAEKGFVNCTRERAGPGVGFSFCWFGFAFGTFRYGSVRFACPF